MRPETSDQKHCDDVIYAEKVNINRPSVTTGETQGKAKTFRLLCFLCVFYF